jgi:hypothetical protein
LTKELKIYNGDEKESSTNGAGKASNLLAED